MNKPKFLYHASPNRNIKIFKPKKEKMRDPKEGPALFATPDKVLASIFIVPTDDSWSNSGLFNGVHYFVCRDREGFERLDKGAIYTLSSETFETHPKKGLREKEWISKVPVKPIAKEEYRSGLEAMLDMGVQVYFVDDDTFIKIVKAQDHGNQILRSSVSENQKRNKKIKVLPKID